jgi:hypothetical protein
MGVPIWTGTPIHGVGFDRPCSKQKVDARTQCFTAAGAVLSAHLKVAQRVSLPAPFDGEFGVQAFCRLHRSQIADVEAEVLPDQKSAVTPSCRSRIVKLGERARRCAASSSRPRLAHLLKLTSKGRNAITSAVCHPCSRAFLLAFGAPGELPLCIRHRPFFSAGDWHACRSLIRARQTDRSFVNFETSPEDLGPRLS